MAPAVIALIAELTAHRETRAEVGRLLRAYRSRVVQEPGNLQFLPYTTVDDAGSFWVYEEYRDEEAFQAHIDSRHNREFNRAVGPLLRSGSSHLRILRPLPTEEAANG